MGEIIGWVILGAFVIKFVLTIYNGFKIVGENQRMYVNRMGKPLKVLGPGFHVLIFFNGIETHSRVKVGDQIKWLGSGNVEFQGLSIPAQAASKLEINDHAVVQGFQGDMIIAERDKSRKVTCEKCGHNFAA